MSDSEVDSGFLGSSNIIDLGDYRFHKHNFLGARGILLSKTINVTGIVTRFQAVNFDMAKFIAVVSLLFSYTFKTLLQKHRGATIVVLGFTIHSLRFQKKLESSLKIALFVVKWRCSCNEDVSEAV